MKQARSSEIAVENVLPDSRTDSSRGLRSGLRYTPESNFLFSEGHKALLSNKWYDTTWEKEISAHMDNYDVFMHAAELNPVGPDRGNDNPEYAEAMSGPERDNWLGGMRDELENVGGRLGCWRIEHGFSKEQIKQLKPLRHKWVSKRHWESGVVSRYRARLTVKGCAQQYGVNFTDTFSPVTNLAILRLILALGVTQNFIYWKADVSNAFPNADLDEEVYMYPPPEMELPEGSLLRLLKALYGLKQAGRKWHIFIAKLLISFGFARMRSEPCVFFMRDNSIGRLIIIVLYVDDFTIASKLQADIDNLLQRLREKIKITDGPLLTILGYRVTDRRHIDHTIRIDMDEYTRLMLRDLAPYIPAGSGVSTPMLHDTYLSADQCPQTE